jgi:xanthine dehydrogenase accessory factor
VAKSSARETTALVLGSDVVPSAIAHALCGRGWCVVLIDDIDPPGPWRGMSFVNAWYFGSAELLNVAACFCASVKSIPTVLNRRNLIAATSWSWQGVASALLPEVVVAARDPARAPSVRAYVAGEHVDVAIDARWEPLSGRPLLCAPRHGRMRSRLRIGDRVEAGEPVGDVNGIGLVAPVVGVLRGITARGARVASGQVVVDIDPHGDAASCYGLAGPAARVADAGVEALSAVLRSATSMSPSRHISVAPSNQTGRLPLP